MDDDTVCQSNKKCHAMLIRKFGWRIHMVYIHVYIYVCINTYILSICLLQKISGPCGVVGGQKNAIFLMVKKGKIYRLLLADSDLFPFT